jgi:hypothetical protein
MKIFFKNTSSRRNAEKRVSDSLEGRDCLQNCPEDTKTWGAKLPVSKSLASSRCKRLEIARGREKLFGKSKYKANVFIKHHSKYEPSISVKDIVNEVLFFKKIVSVETKINENFSQNFSLREEEKLKALKSEADCSNATNSINKINILNNNSFKIENEINNLNIIKESPQIELDVLIDNQSLLNEIKNLEDKKSSSISNYENIDDKDCSSEAKEVNQLENSDDNVSLEHKKFKTDERSSDNNSFYSIERTRPIDLRNLKEPTRAELYESAKCLKNVILNHPNCIFSQILKKMFIAHQMSKNQNSSDDHFMKLLQELVKQYASSKDVAESTGSSNKETPLAKEKNIKDKLVQKFICAQPPVKKIVFAEMSTRRAISSYKEAKDVLINIFEFNFNEFSGVTLTPDKKSWAFMAEEDAVLKYCAKLPCTNAGDIRPWLDEEIQKRIPLITDICRKIASNPPKNKAIKTDAKFIMKLLNDGDWPQKNQFTVEEFRISRPSAATRL